MRNKGWLWAVFLLIISLLLSGCALPAGITLKGINDEPEATPEALTTPAERPEGCEGAALDLLEALKEGRRSELRLFSEEIPGYNGLYTRPLYTAAYSSLQWKLQGYKEGQGGYTLTVELTVRDMQQVLERLYEAVALQQTPGCDRYVLAERLLSDILDESDYPTITKREKMTLSRATGTWRLLHAESFLNAASGGLPRALAEFDLPPALYAETPLADEDAVLNQCFYRDGQRSFTVLSTHPNDPEGYRIMVECVNHTDGERVFTVRSMVVNGFVFDVDRHFSVPAGQSVTESIILPRGRMESGGIERVRNIIFSLEVFTAHAWPVYPELSVPCAVYPHGRDDSHDPLPAREGQQRLLDSWCAGFTVLDIIDEGCWGCSLLVAVDNRSEEALWFSVGEMLVDGRDHDPGWSQLLGVGSKAVEEIRIGAGALMLGGGDGAAELDFRVFVSDLADPGREEEGVRTQGHYTIAVE